MKLTVGGVITWKFLLSFPLGVPAELTFRGLGWGRNHKLMGPRTQLDRLQNCSFPSEFIAVFANQKGPKKDAGLQLLSKTHKISPHQARFPHGDNDTDVRSHFSLQLGHGPSNWFTAISTPPTLSFTYQPRVCKHCSLQPTF